MKTAHCTITVKNRAKKNTTDQDTPQDKERLKITPMERGRLFTTMIRKATNNNKKAIKKWQEWYDPKEPIEDYARETTTTMQQYAEASSASSDTTAFTSPGACMR
jgi:hypothetical protein